MCAICSGHTVLISKKLDAHPYLDALIAIVDRRNELVFCLQLFGNIFDDPIRKDGRYCVACQENDILNGNINWTTLDQAAHRPELRQAASEMCNRLMKLKAFL